MPIKGNESIARRFEQAFSSGNTADAAELIAPSFTPYARGVPQVPPGPEGHRELVRYERESFRDLEVAIEGMVVAEDKAAIRLRARGTQRGEFAGITRRASKRMIPFSVITGGCRWRDDGASLVD